jgi:hypothetical protein
LGFFKLFFYYNQSRRAKIIKRNFKQAKIQYFYLTSLVASLITGKPGFKILLRLCEFIDAILLKLPLIRRQAWMVLIELEQPIKQDFDSV